MAEQKPPNGEPDSPSSEEPYAVGYGRPPKDFQFKKGQSGNDKGRPKGSRNLMSELRKIYTEPVVISVGGKQQHVPAIVAIALVQRQRALNADPRAAEAVFKKVKELGFLDEAPEYSVCDYMYRETLSRLSNSAFDELYKLEKEMAEKYRKKDKTH